MSQQFSNPRALDADTVEIEIDGKRVRLRLPSANAPETNESKPYDMTQPLAREATEFTKNFISDPAARLSDTQGSDKYGRTLGDIINSDGKSLNQELIREGLAKATYGDDPQAKANADLLGLKEVGLAGGATTEQQVRAIERRAFQREQTARLLGTLQPKYRNVYDDRGFHEKALDRGLDQVELMGSGLAKWIGDLTGVDMISEFGKRGISENQIDVLLNPRSTKSFTESEGFSESVVSIYESLIEQAPNIGVTFAAGLATGGIGGLVGRGAAARVASGEVAASTATQRVFQNAIANTKKGMWKDDDRFWKLADLVKKEGIQKGFATGAKIGAGSASFGMNTGETKTTFEGEGFGDDNIEIGLIGALKGAVDMVGLSQIPGFNKLVGFGVRNASKKTGQKLTRDKFLKHVPFGIMRATAAEGTTEAFQSAADIFAINAKKGASWSPENTDELIEAFVVGAASGGVMGTLGAGAQKVTKAVIEAQNKSGTVQIDPEDIEARAKVNEALSAEDYVIATANIQNHLMQVIIEGGEISEQEMKAIDKHLEDLAAIGKMEGEEGSMANDYYAQLAELYNEYRRSKGMDEGSFMSKELPDVSMSPLEQLAYTQAQFAANMLSDKEVTVDTSLERPKVYVDGKYSPIATKAYEAGFIDDQGQLTVKVEETLVQEPTPVPEPQPDLDPTVDSTDDATAVMEPVSENEQLRRRGFNPDEGGDTRTQTRVAKTDSEGGAVEFDAGFSTKKPPKANDPTGKFQTIDQAQEQVIPEDSREVEDIVTDETATSDEIESQLRWRRDAVTAFVAITGASTKHRTNITQTEYQQIKREIAILEGVLNQKLIQEKKLNPELDPNRQTTAETKKSIEAQKLDFVSGSSTSRRALWVSDDKISRRAPAVELKEGRLNHPQFRRTTNGKDTLIYEVVVNSPSGERGRMYFKSKSEAEKYVSYFKRDKPYSISLANALALRYYEMDTKEAVLNRVANDPTDKPVVYKEIKVDRKDNPILDENGKEIELFAVVTTLSKLPYVEKMAAEVFGKPKEGHARRIQNLDVDEATSRLERTDEVRAQATREKQRLAEKGQLSTEPLNEVETAYQDQRTQKSDQARKEEGQLPLEDYDSRSEDLQSRQVVRDDEGNIISEPQKTKYKSPSKAAKAEKKEPTGEPKMDEKARKRIHKLAEAVMIALAPANITTVTNKKIFDVAFLSSAKVMPTIEEAISILERAEDDPNLFITEQKKLQNAFRLAELVRSPLQGNAARRAAEGLAGIRIHDHDLSQSDGELLNKFFKLFRERDAKHPSGVGAKQQFIVAMDTAGVKLENPQHLELDLPKDKLTPEGLATLSNLLMAYYETNQLPEDTKALAIDVLRAVEGRGIDEAIDLYERLENELDVTVLDRIRTSEASFSEKMAIIQEYKDNVLPYDFLVNGMESDNTGRLRALWKALDDENIEQHILDSVRRENLAGGMTEQQRELLKQANDLLKINFLENATDEQLAKHNLRKEIRSALAEGMSLKQIMVQQELKAGLDTLSPERRRIFEAIDKRANDPYNRGPRVIALRDKMLEVITARGLAALQASFVPNYRVSDSSIPSLSFSDALKAERERVDAALREKEAENERQAELRMKHYDSLDAAATIAKNERLRKEKLEAKAKDWAKKRANNPVAIIEEFQRQIAMIARAKVQEKQARNKRSKTNEPITITKQELLDILTMVFAADGPNEHPLSALYSQIFANLPDTVSIKMSDKGKAPYVARYLAEGERVEVNTSDEILAGEAILHELTHSVTLYHGTLADVAIQIYGAKATVTQLLKDYRDGRLDGRLYNLSVVKDILENASEESIMLAQEMLAAHKAFKETEFYKSGKAAKVTSNANFETVAEFFATAISNPRMMEALEQETGTNTQKSLLDKVFEAIANYFGFLKNASLLKDIFKTTVAVSVAEASLSRRRAAAQRMTMDGTINRTTADIVDEVFGEAYSAMTPRNRSRLTKITDAIRKAFSGKSLKSFSSKGLDLASFFLTSYRRIHRLAPTLAALFYTVPGKANPLGKAGGYLNNYAKSFHKWGSKLQNDVFKGMSTAEKQKMYDDYMAGKNTPETAKLKKFLKEFHEYLGSSSVDRISLLGKKLGDKMPPVFDVVSIEENREAFIDFLMGVDRKDGPFKALELDGKNLSIDRAKAEQILNAILTKTSYSDNNPQVAAPGLRRDMISSPEFIKEAYEAGWLMKNPSGALEFHINTLSRQKARDEVIGDWLETRKPTDADTAKALQYLGYSLNISFNKDGTAEPDAKKFLDKVYNDALARGLIRETDSGFEYFRSNQKVAEIIADEPNPTKKAELEKVMLGMDGLLGVDMNETLKSASEWVAFTQSVTILGMSTLTSIPEAGVLIASAAAKSLGATWKGLINTLTNYKEARALADAFGTTHDAILTSIWMDESGRQVSGMPRYLTTKFFQLNLNTFWNNFLRTLATNIGINYMVEKATDAKKGVPGAKKALARWDISADDVIAWNKAGRPHTLADGSTHPIATVLLNFTDAHSTRPMSANKMVVGNDKRWQLFHQMKGFFYGYGAVIIPEIGRTMGDRYNAAMERGDHKAMAVIAGSVPLVGLGLAALPLAFLANSLKEGIKGLSEDDDFERWKEAMKRRESPQLKFANLVRDSGVLGPVDMVFSLYDEEQAGRSALVRYMGPAAGHASTLLSNGPFHPDTVKRSTPLLGTLAPGLFREWKREYNKEQRAKNKREAREARRG